MREMDIPKPSKNHLSRLEEGLAVEDKAVVDAAYAILRRSSHMALRKIKCDCQHHVLIVHGGLPTFHSRQIMLSLLNTLEGICRVDDRTKIADEPAGPEDK